MSAVIPGISVIVPTVVGSATRVATLRSLKQQSLAADLYEVVLVINGPGALEEDCEQYSQEFGALNLRILRTESPGAGRARNLGIAAANRKYLTFVDDDDEVEPNYLKAAFDAVGPNTCALLPIVDCVDGKRVDTNSHNMRITSIAGSKVPATAVPWALGFNACKVFPTELAQRFRFRETLRSGEDVVYFAHLLSVPGMTVSVPKMQPEQAYVRHMVADSVSRQVENFDFNVMQRLACIAELRQIEVPEPAGQALTSLENAQFGFVQRYLEKNSGSVDEAISEAVRLGITGLDWESVRAESAKRVVFSYCFPPYADTSANVAAKVIRARGELVDVYSANMSRVRGKDDSTLLIVEPFVGHSVEIATEPSFANWGLICDYARKAVRSATIQQRKKQPYESMYSRALWSGSHVAALLHKAKFPDAIWEAEFSDPMALGIDGTLRPGELTWNRTTAQLAWMLKRSAWSVLKYQTHFELTELATFVFADRIIFTNANQQQVMLERYPGIFQEFVRAKSVIRHHAIPTPEMYSLVDAHYGVDENAVNLAYFGNFYERRGVGDVIAALQQGDFESPVVLHIFTSKPDELVFRYRELVDAGKLRVNGYVPYLEFLNLASMFDALIVTDTDTEGTNLSVNPFLPSKYSDYVGAGAAVWSLVNEGSPLSELPVDLKSYLGDVDGAIALIRQLCPGGE